eukprot:TRINITY_DN113076_c0_g1_i1.p1 TRINITY_DN113076_c0_g1~~TRINITY_DN113076_c0_g1_i1.p1  ORF type:complete len:138 (+),score=15.50 TRINITY_DN113076_c0_g1_i1:72-485(+)
MELLLRPPTYAYKGKVYIVTGATGGDPTDGNFYEVTDFTGDATQEEISTLFDLLRTSWASTFPNADIEVKGCPNTGAGMYIKIELSPDHCATYHQRDACAVSALSNEIGKLLEEFRAQKFPDVLAAVQAAFNKKPES